MATCQLEAWWHKSSSETSNAFLKHDSDEQASAWMMALVIIFGFLYLVDTVVAALAVAKAYDTHESEECSHELRPTHHHNPDVLPHAHGSLPLVPNIAYSGSAATMPLFATTRCD